MGPAVAGVLLGCGVVRSVAAAPCALASKVHTAPRLLGEDRTFDASDRYYYFSVDVGLSVAALSVALLAIYVAYSCVRSCCFRRAQVVGVDRDEAPRVAYDRYAVMVLAGLSVVAALCSAFGGGRSLEATAAIADDLDWLSKYFQTFDRYESVLGSYGSTLVSATGRLTCEGSGSQDVARIRQLVDWYLRDVAQIWEATSGVEGKFGEAADYASAFGRWFEVALLAVVAIVCLVLLPTWVSDRRCCASRSTKGLDVVGRVAISALVLLSLALALEGGFAVRVADFCVRADANVVDVIRREVEEPASAAVTYYATCAGPNPVAGPVRLSLGDVDEIAAATADARRAGCAPAAALAALDETCVRARAVLKDLEAYAACKAPNSHYEDLVHDGFCGDFLCGLVHVAYAHAATWLAVYALLWLTHAVCQQVRIDDAKRDFIRATTPLESVVDNDDDDYHHHHENAAMMVHDAENSYILADDEGGASLRTVDETLQDIHVTLDDDDGGGGGGGFRPDMPPPSVVDPIAYHANSLRSNAELDRLTVTPVTPHYSATSSKHDNARPATEASPPRHLPPTRWL